MMFRVVRVTITIVGPFALLYLLASFVQLTFDATLWAYDTRLSLVVWYSLTTPVLITVALLSNPPTRTKQTPTPNTVRSNLNNPT